jgi:hypothetical protein
MVAVVAGRDWPAVRQPDRLRASRVTSALVQACFDSGVELVTVAGSTLSAYEWDGVTAGLQPIPRVLYVLLRVSLQESIRRAQGDPERISTKDPAFVAQLAAAINWKTVRPPDVEIDTDALTADEVIDRLALRIWGIS